MSPPQHFDASRRASAVLDAARSALAGVTARPPAGLPAEQARRVAIRANDLLVWAGSWLDEPYRPAPASARTAAAELPHLLRRLDELARAFEELVETFEDEDPVANANGVQTGSLGFAIVSDAHSRLRRLAGGGGTIH